MRMRKKPNLEERLKRCEQLVIKEPESLRGKWSELSGGRRICLEIGCGKGRFITETAKESQETFFIGIEREPGAIVMALEKAYAAGLSNIGFINADAASLDSIFDEREVEGIYLNFSDPWPKNRHAKRRLTHEGFLKKYDKILCENGWIFLKTDNERLFEYSLNSFSDFGYRLKNITFNLHETDTRIITTEYEERFISQGMRIYRVEAHKK